MNRLVIDIATLRVIYFSKDESELITIPGRCVQRDWIDDIPESMTLQNCWDWKLRGDKLVNTEENNLQPQSRMDRNRMEAIKFLNQRIDITRTALLPTCKGGEFIRTLKLKDDEYINMLAMACEMDPKLYKINVMHKADVYEDLMKATEINREFYTHKFKNCSEDKELLNLRDFVSSTDLTALPDEMQ